MHAYWLLLATPAKHCPKESVRVFLTFKLLFPVVVASLYTSGDTFGGVHGLLQVEKKKIVFLGFRLGGFYPCGRAALCVGSVLCPYTLFLTGPFCHPMPFNGEKQTLCTMTCGIVDPMTDTAFHIMQQEMLSKDNVDHCNCIQVYLNQKAG